MYEMGRRPDFLRVILVPGQDFLCELDITTEGATFGGSAPQLIFADGTTFESSLIEDGSVASFLITSFAIDDLLKLTDRSVALVHQDVTLAKGEFEVD